MPIKPENMKRYLLDVVCLYTDDTKTLMSKGHHDPAEFRKACEFWNGGPLTDWGGKIRHAWGRTVPDSSGNYEFLMLSAKPHARGAYPVTTIIDDAAYDHDHHRTNAQVTRRARAGTLELF